MAVAELGSRGQAPEFERTPPQDVSAEQSVLGGMLLSKDAIADVVEVLRSGDFYRPQHQTVFEAVIDLYGRGEPADPVTVAAELTRQGTIARVGGAPYLHTLVASVPTAANAGYYARIVAERAVLRRLVEAGTRIVQLGYADAGGDVDDLVDRAQQAVYDVTERRTSEDYVRLEEVMQAAFDEIEAAGSRGSALVGVPTGITDLDELTNGLHPGQMVVVAARPAIGKCLAGDTLVVEALTGELVPIAELVRRGAAGVDVAIRALTPDGFRPVRPSAFLYNGVRPVSRLSTAMGRSVRATGNHPFLTPAGWVPLERLRPGDLVAVPAGDVPRQLPPAAGVDPAMPAGATDEGLQAGGATVTLVTAALALSCISWDCVVAIEPDGQERVYDITVPEHHNFVAAGMVVHNSTLGLDFARAASIRHGLASVIFSLEMSRTEITMRLLSAESRVPLHHMRSGKMSDDDWARLARRMGEVAEAPLFIDDSPNMTMMEIRAKARRLRQRHDLRLVVVDYMQLMSSAKRVESRQQEVAEMSRALKLLAKELEVPVVAISQLNRGPEQRTDKKPQLSDLRESGSIEQDADMVILLHREDAYERESPRAGEADLIVAKHRNGPTATITVAFQGHYSRFVDMSPA
ncbi:MAG: replicative DNA helicase [Frankiaceae bacterium]